jgi:hypothetical protein
VRPHSASKPDATFPIAVNHIYRVIRQTIGRRKIKEGFSVETKRATLGSTPHDALTVTINGPNTVGRQTVRRAEVGKPAPIVVG